MRPAFRPGHRLLAAALVTACTLLPAPPATAAEPIGGKALGGTRIIVDRSAGVPALPEIGALGWLVADLDSGAVLAARNPHGKFLPASTIKTLTALSLLPKLDPKKLVKPSRDAANMPGTQVGIEADFPVTVDFLFTGMLIWSGNDTAQALAEAAGGEAATVALMNAEAKRLQANDTLAVNVSGLDARDQYSSPYDLALIGRAALKNEAFRRYTAIKKTMVPNSRAPFEIANKNALLYTYDGAFGGKTGGTIKAGNTYIGFAQRGSRRLVVTIMKTLPAKWRTEAPLLLDWGFAAAEVATPVGQLVNPVDEPQTPLSTAPASQAAPPAAATTSSVASTAPSVSAATPAMSVQNAKPESDDGLFDWLPSPPSISFRWWYAAAPVAFAALVAIGLAWRARRRRRRGFYMPQTKLRLPVR